MRDRQTEKRCENQPRFQFNYHEPLSHIQLVMDSLRMTVIGDAIASGTGVLEWSSELLCISYK